MTWWLQRNVPRLASVVCMAALAGCGLERAVALLDAPRAIVLGIGEIVEAVEGEKDSGKGDRGEAAAKPLAELKARADEGDVEAMYEYASRINDKAEEWKLNCRAANQNHPGAQFSVAMHHRWGFYPLEQDVLRAYVWFRLAELNGYESRHQQKPYSEVLADDMTPSELADGERLVSEWKPNPAECVVAPTSPSG